MKPIELKMRKQIPAIYAGFQISEKTKRLGIHVKHMQHEQGQDTTIYAWMDRRQAESIYKWLGKFLGKRK